MYTSVYNFPFGWTQRVLREEVPEYQKDNSGANRYNEIVCCVFGSLLLYSPPLWIFQSKKQLSK